MDAPIFIFIDGSAINVNEIAFIVPYRTDEEPKNKSNIYLTVNGYKLSTFMSSSEIYHLIQKVIDDRIRTAKYSK